MFESEAIGPAATLTLRPAPVITVSPLPFGTPIASAGGAEARRGRGPRTPAPRRWPRPGMFESEAIGPAATLTLRPAPVTTAAVLLLGITIASDDDARPSGRPRSPVPRR